jgi:hypothetical protein
MLCFMDTNLAEHWEQMYLPLRPLCTNAFVEGVYRQPREKALGVFRYVEANPRNVSDLLVVDIDDENARAMALWEHEHMQPNVIVENPANGHAHAVWALQTPFSRTEYSRRKPLAYAAAITEGLRRSCDGDKGYSGLMTKNPLHPVWDSELVTDHLYTMDELAGSLKEAGDLPQASWRRSERRNNIGLGRNCSLFETARTWAYPLVRSYPDRSQASCDDLRERITTHAHAINLETNDEPLPAREVEQIAKSIHKWITTRFYGWTDGATVCEATFTAIQSARGRKGGAASGRARLRGKTLEQFSQEMFTL